MYITSGGKDVLTPLVSSNQTSGHGFIKQKTSPELFKLETIGTSPKYFKQDIKPKFSKQDVPTADLGKVFSTLLNTFESRGILLQKIFGTDKYTKAEEQKILIDLTTTEARYLLCSNIAWFRRYADLYDDLLSYFIKCYLGSNQKFSEELKEDCSNIGPVLSRLLNDGKGPPSWNYAHINKMLGRSEKDLSIVVNYQLHLSNQEALYLFSIIKTDDFETVKEQEFKSICLKISRTLPMGTKCPQSISTEREIMSLEKFGAKYPEFLMGDTNPQMEDITPQNKNVEIIGHQPDNCSLY